MLLAFAVAILIGVVIAVVTAVDPRLRIADEVKIAALVCVSGAVAGWAVVDTVAGVGGEGLDLWDILAAVAGATGIATAAWRGRRRTFDELGLSAQTRENQTV